MAVSLFGQDKFFYNARGPLVEAVDHWLDLLKERELVDEEGFKKINSIVEKLSLKLNNCIKATYNAKDKKVK